MYVKRKYSPIGCLAPSAHLAGLSYLIVQIRYFYFRLQSFQHSIYPIDCIPKDRSCLYCRYCTKSSIRTPSFSNQALGFFGMFRLSFALLLFCAILSVAENLQYRQENNTSTTTASVSPLASSSSISTSQSVEAQITTDLTTSSDTKSTSLQGAAKTSSTTASPTNAQAQSSTSEEAKSSTSKEGSSHTTSSSTTPTGSVTQKIVTTIISTSGSVTLSITSTSSQVIAAALASSSGSPGLSGNNGGSGSSGLSSKSKSIVGGVVGGVGGAILLGGLAIVCWRVWGKNRRSHAADNDLMDPQPGQEKSSSVSGHSPFVSQPFSMIHRKVANQ